MGSYSPMLNRIQTIRNKCRHRRIRHSLVAVCLFLVSLGCFTALTGCEALGIRKALLSFSVQVPIDNITEPGSTNDLPPPNGDGRVTK